MSVLRFEPGDRVSIKVLHRCTPGWQARGCVCRDADIDMVSGRKAVVIRREQRGVVGQSVRLNDYLIKVDPFRWYHFWSPHYWCMTLDLTKVCILDALAEI